jgi:hypothetical protein
MSGKTKKKKKKQRSVADEMYRRMEEVISCMPDNILVRPLDTEKPIPDPRTRWTVCDAIGMSRCPDILLAPREGEGEGDDSEADIMDEVKLTAAREYKTWNHKETRLYLDVAAVFN